LVALGLLTLVALLAAPRAEAVPSVTYKCTPAPQDCTGWHQSDVSIDWTVLPSDATVIGCQDKQYTTDTAGTNEFCSADDDTAARYQLKLRWTYAGKPRRLTPGHYRWMVWPGYGPRSKADYGKAIGRSTFVVKR
jgi:hypothetical protein